jgi:hypothetical protein
VVSESSIFLLPLLPMLRLYLDDDEEVSRPRLPIPAPNALPLLFALLTSGISAEFGSSGGVVVPSMPAQPAAHPPTSALPGGDVYRGGGAGGREDFVVRKLLERTGCSTCTGDTSPGPLAHRPNVSVEEFAPITAGRICA